MLDRLRSTLVALAFAGVTIGAALADAAQDEPKPPDDVKTPAATSAEPKTYPPFRRVPSYFGMVGLSDQQRSDIYAVRGRYQMEIGELKRRMEELSRQEMSECESILTDAQRKLLAQLRDARRPTLPSEGE